MKPRSANQCPLVSFRPPSETSQVPSGRVRFLWPRPAEPSTAPPLRFLPLQRFPHTWQRLCCSGLPHLNACASGFSQPPDAFIRPVPAGLVSCRIRSWGSPFRAFLLPRSLPPSPASVPSCRSTNPIPSPTRVAPATQAQLVRRPPCGKVPRNIVAFRGLLHAKVRHCTTAVLRPSRARSSLGFLPSRGVPLTGTAWLSPVPPLTSLLSRAQATCSAAPQGIDSSEVGLPLSRPPPLLGFFRLMTATTVWVGRRLGSHLLRLRGASPSPRQAIFEPI